MSDRVSFQWEDFEDETPAPPDQLHLGLALLMVSGGMFIGGIALLLAKVFS